MTTNEEAIRQAWNGLHAAAQQMNDTPGNTPARHEARGALLAYSQMTATLTGRTVADVIGVAQRRLNER